MRFLLSPGVLLCCSDALIGWKGPAQAGVASRRRELVREMAGPLRSLRDKVSPCLSSESAPLAA